MKKIILTLDENQITALETAAEIDFRSRERQAVFFIQRELERQGLITVTKPPNSMHPPRTKSNHVQNGESQHDNQTPH